MIANGEKFMASASRHRRVLAALAAALILVASVAEARPGRGGGFGSRGSRTFDAAPSTNTAPRTAAPIQRSTTQPGVNQAAPRAAAATQGGFFGRRGGFLGGFLGAGLIGAMLGYGLFAGFGGLGSILGFLLQLVLIVVLVRWAVRAFQRRSQPAYAGASMGPTATDSPAPAARPMGGFGGRARQAPLTVSPGDYDSFEKLLGTIQTSYGQNDRAVLRRNATPEMAGYLEAELDSDAARGVANRIDDVRLLQGDLAESWSENGSDYATVAMRYGLKDSTVELASGRVVEGDADKPTEVTELWTFRRDRGSDWVLSAIQQS